MSEVVGVGQAVLEVAVTVCDKAVLYSVMGDITTEHGDTVALSVLPTQPADPARRQQTPTPHQIRYITLVK